jgi:hypothetical protein
MFHESAQQAVILPDVRSNLEQRSYLGKPQIQDFGGYLFTFTRRGASQ